MNRGSVPLVKALALCAILAMGVAFPAFAQGLLIPFTTYQAEKQEVLTKLPCRWVSMDGRDGIRRDESKYDFLCKGGVWATVSLMLDQAEGWRDGVGQVRLVFREWPAAVHPGGGESFVAQQFLQHVVDHFVPANLGVKVLEGFWQNRDKSWRGNGVRIEFSTEDFGNHLVRRLEIKGIGRTLDPRVGGSGAEKPLPMDVMSEPQAKVPVATVPAQRGGLMEDAKGWWKGLTQTPAQVPAQPTPVAVQPVAQPIPVVAATPTPTEVLRFIAEPAPESLVSMTAPGAVPANLVPTAEQRIGGREAAPAGFDAYNKAQQLTQPFEVKSIADPNANPKVFKAGEATGLLVAPSPTTVTGPTLAPVATPAVSDGVTPTDAGLSKPGTQEVTVDNAVQVPSEDPRFAPERALPQLKYIPKARPVDAPSNVIEFEDEKSSL